MMRYRTGFGVGHLFVTHLHGDHILGISGPIQTSNFNDRDDLLAIHGPPGGRGYPERLVYAGGYQPSSHVSVHEVRPGNVAYRADDHEVRAFDTEHRIVLVSYAFVEDDCPGRLDREKAEEPGVPVGPAFGRFRTGEDVELEDGTVVRSEQVVGDPRPGRTVVYTGDTRLLNLTVKVVCDADLLVYDATFADGEVERAKQTAYSTARGAACVARGTDVRRLALTHISAWYVANPGPLLEQTCEVYDDEVFVVEDGQKLEVPYADSGGGEAEAGE